MGTTNNQFILHPPFDTKRQKSVDVNRSLPTKSKPLSPEIKLLASEQRKHVYLFFWTNRNSSLPNIQQKGESKFQPTLYSSLLS